jgi:hypothetical protein
MNDIDSKIYRLLERCAAAKLPVLFCGDDPSRKWELIATLKAQLATVDKGPDEQGF